ncbi:MAG: PDZ domain-containing protein, partial [Longimicrobiales bacterium]|nr:PDZ domain-containing protein [Longimicrobiales bacterium]
MGSNLGLARRVAVVSLLFVVGCGRGDATAQERQAEQADPPAVTATPVDTSTAAALSRTFRAAAAKALPSVVSVTVTSQPESARQQLPFPFPFGQPDPGGEPAPQMGTGSGFVLTADGHIVTNNHVVANATEVEIRFPDGRIYSDVEVVGRDQNTDVAVLKIEPRDGETLTPLEVGSSDALQVGDWVLALGNPLTLDFTVTAGIVSAKGRDLNILPQQTGLEAFIQTDAAINRGNSGGPLVDLYGRVVGVNTAIYSPTGTYAGNGFAVPSALAIKAARDIIEYGYVRRPRIGVFIQNVTEAQAELYGLDAIRGAYVTEVQPDGPAADAGIEPEDIIVSLNGEPIESSTHLTTRLARLQPGQEVTLGVIRDGDRMSVDMELGQFELEQPETRVAERERTAEDLLGVTVTNIEELSRRDLQTLDLRDADMDGVVVTDVARYGPAAGVLSPGDIILEFNRETVRDVSDLRRLARDVERGDVVVLRLRRAATGNTGVAS